MDWNTRQQIRHDYSLCKITKAEIAHKYKLKDSEVNAVVDGVYRCVWMKDIKAMYEDGYTIEDIAETTERPVEEIREKIFLSSKNEDERVREILTLLDEKHLPWENLAQAIKVTKPYFKRVLKGERSMTDVLYNKCIIALEGASNVETQKDYPKNRMLNVIMASKGLKVADLSKMTGVSQDSIYALVNYRKELTEQTATRIANGIGVPIQLLWDGYYDLLELIKSYEVEYDRE